MLIGPSSWVVLPDLAIPKARNLCSIVPYISACTIGIYTEICMYIIYKCIYILYYYVSLLYITYYIFLSYILYSFSNIYIYIYIIIIYRLTVILYNIVCILYIYMCFLAVPLRNQIGLSLLSSLLDSGWRRSGGRLRGYLASLLLWRLAAVFNRSAWQFHGSYLGFICFFEFIEKNMWMDLTGIHVIEFNVGKTMP